MDEISFAGYGFDITDFDLTVLTEAEHQIFDQLIDSDKVLDAVDELSDHGVYDDVVVGTPCNTTDFELFIYIPDQAVVGIDPHTIKVYTYHEANQRLAAYFKTFMHDLNSMMETPLDREHTAVFLSLIHKLGAQLTDDEGALPGWRTYNDYC